MNSLQNFSSQTILNSSLGKYVPILMFLAFYILTCVIGAALILGGYRPYMELVILFSGTIPPLLTGNQLLINLLLLFVSPVLMCCAYVVGLLVADRINLSAQLPPSPANLPTSLPALIAGMVFYVLAGIALTDIYAAGAFGNMGRWLDYGYWIEARYQLFSALSFFSFVNIYIFVPVAAAWALISWRSRTKTQHIFRGLPTVITVVIGLMVFQKKTVIVSMLLITFTWTLWRISTGQIKNLGKLVVFASGAIVLAYFVLVVVPIYSDTSRTLADALDIKAPYAPTSSSVAQSTRKQLTTIAHPFDTHDVSPPSTAAQPTRKRLIALAHSFDIQDHDTRILLYAIMAPLSRTSVPALYYPVVFPEHHPFYGLYFGQNFLGLGDVPNDNTVVWNYMNPHIPGAVAAPFQFALYSQLGLSGALIGSAIVGLALALLWSLARSSRITEPWRSLLGSLVMLAAIYLALDSLHNEVIASYGVSWGVLFVVAAWILTLGVNRAILSLRLRAKQS